MAISFNSSVSHPSKSLTPVDQTASTKAISDDTSTSAFDDGNLALPPPRPMDVQAGGTKSNKFTVQQLMSQSRAGVIGGDPYDEF